MMHRVLPLLALIFAVAIFFLYINPTWTGSLATVKAQIAQDNQSLDMISAYTKQETALTNARNAMDQTSLDRLQSFLPDSVNNVAIILDLNALAARSGLSLKSINVTQSDAADGTSDASGASFSPTGSVDLSLAASGTYSSILSFLQGVELSERLLDLRDVKISGSDTGVYDVGMTIRLYWLR
jgi:Tfp pilus assembly protein PilO